VLKSIISAAAKGEAVSSLMNKQIADELSIGEGLSRCIAAAPCESWAPNP
jgi:hypothetical protein